MQSDDNNADEIGHAEELIENKFIESVEVTSNLSLKVASQNDDVFVRTMGIIEVTSDDNIDEMMFRNKGVIEVTNGDNMNEMILYFASESADADGEKVCDNSVELQLKGKLDLKNRNHFRSACDDDANIMILKKISTAVLPVLFQDDKINSYVREIFGNSNYETDTSSSNVPKHYQSCQDIGKLMIPPINNVRRGIIVSRDQYRGDLAVYDNVGKTKDKVTWHISCTDYLKQYLTVYDNVGKIKDEVTWRISCIDYLKQFLQ